MLEGQFHTERVVQDQSKEGNECPSVHGLTTLSDISLLEVKLENRYQAPSDLSIFSFSNACITWNVNIYSLRYKSQ